LLIYISCAIGFLPRKYKRTLIQNHTLSSVFDECLYSRLYQLMLDTAGCTSPWVFKQSNICRTHNESLAAFDISWNFGTNQNRTCLEPCRFFLVNIGSKNLDKNESLSMSKQTFYFPSRVVVNEELFLYTFLSMVAEVGGYVGLLLGVSFLQGSFAINSWIDSKIIYYMIEGGKKKIKEENTN
jgi:hypothetical protein